jgi:E3 ubiquitin-protein ligase listerin
MQLTMCPQVQLYPRLSIDNSRRVRELSHTLQFDLTRSTRKRMEKQFRRIIGAWLAGVYDSDRVVSRAANDGLSSFLTTPEKSALFWTKCQPFILEYATEAIQETQDTLSDERSTTEDDAVAKYHRVVAASLSLFLGLLQKLQQADINTQLEAYEKYLAMETVWESATFNDTKVRKTACQMLLICLDRHPDMVVAQKAKLKRIFLSKGLKMKQIGSALEYVMVLTKLTERFSDIWSPAAGSSKSPVSLLSGFLERGSQGSSVQYWGSASQLLVSIPSQDVPSAAVPGILKAFRVGISNREEPRRNATAAWGSYINVVRHFLNSHPDEATASFLEDALFPLTRQYLFPTPEHSTWAIGGAAAEKPMLDVLVQAHVVGAVACAQRVTTAVANEWAELAKSFITRMSNSLPEASKDYDKSQDAILQEGNRWFMLAGHISDTASEQLSPLEKPSKAIATFCIGLLPARDLKPYGCAGVLSSIGHHAPKLLERLDRAEIVKFLEGQVSRLDIVMRSRTGPHLISCINALGAMPNVKQDYERAWLAWVDALLAFPQASTPKNSYDEQIAAFLSLLICQQPAAHLAQEHSGLGDYLSSKGLACARGDGTEAAWKLFETTLTSTVLPEDTLRHLSMAIVGLLGDEETRVDSTLRALELLATAKPGLLSGDDAIHTALVGHLLSLTEIGDAAVSSKVISLRALLDAHSTGTVPVVSIIQRNLERADAQSLE